jgi:hypothetical protein
MVPCIHCEDAQFSDFVAEHFVGHKIVKAERISDQIAELTLDNGEVIVAEGNEGCGGCGNGWYYLEQLASCDNIITNAELVVDGYNEVYALFVFVEDNRYNVLTYEGYDNGYYGAGFYITVKSE